jgi:hypothetical protein
VEDLVTLACIEYELTVELKTCGSAVVFKNARTQLVKEVGVLPEYAIISASIKSSPESGKLLVPKTGITVSVAEIVCGLTLVNPR